MPGRNAPDMIRIIPTITKHNSFFVLDSLRMKIAPKVERRTPACERLKLIASPILEIEIRRKRFPIENSTPVIKKVEKIRAGINEIKISMKYIRANAF